MSAETDSRQNEIETQNASACPVVQAIDQIGTPWRLNVIYALKEGEQRFNELKRATGARSKTLSDALDELVENDIVTRRMEEDAPVAVYYGLSRKGDELVDVLAGLDEWAQEWGEEVPDGPNPRLRDD
ncbi:helix-turn-helix domain-containing protein [Natrinema sp. 1APR25-10V2]|uniref:winged helix-turn-helix transcriptional regulator n=1 Tax=Natrinema sp. 1APR25-10V2 TaxID=2951081 RepID=UPI002876CFCF|nr:helix-turn-helix domain-containing protein [Natrinema sp. 1APR25-10V2]MDS0477176.1 helix-turn-helix transcriptional regulator [Natrinema sp. 1APR25-10V2]